MDWSFASSCSPPRLSATQFPSATDSQCSVRWGLPPHCWCALSGALSQPSRFASRRASSLLRDSQRRQSEDAPLTARTLRLMRGEANRGGRLTTKRTGSVLIEGRAGDVIWRVRNPTPDRRKTPSACKLRRISSAVVVSSASSRKALRRTTGLSVTRRNALLVISFSAVWKTVHRQRNAGSQIK
jgi:hypothetical protein